MDFSQKRKCGSCYCNFFNGLTSTRYCGLGYKTKTDLTKGSGFIIPLEPCPKPLSMTKYFTAKGNKRVL